MDEARCIGVGQRKCRESLGLELRVFDDGGYLIMEVSRELRGGGVRTSNGGRRLQAEW